MKLYYPLLLKDKLLKIINHHQFTINFHEKLKEKIINLNPELKEKVINKCIDLWLYIYTAQQKQYENNVELRNKLDRKKISLFREPVPINKVSLQKRFVIYRHLYYNHLVKILKNIDVIEVSDWYRVKGDKEGVPKSYRIKEEVIKSHFGEFVWMEPTDLIDRYTFKTKENWIKDYPQHRKLIENHYLATIDTYSLERELKGLVILGEMSIQQYFSYLNQSLMFNGRYFWFSQKDGKGRFYSSFTTLPKIIRKHINLDGSFICEVDLKNALPLFLSYILKQPEFKKDCLEGIFWDKLSSNMNMPRDDVKLQFLTHIVYKEESKTLYYSPEYIKMYNIIETFYPGLYDMIDDLRSRCDIFEKYTDLESKIFVDGMKIFDFPYLSIHDSLVVRNLPLDKDRAIDALNCIFKSKGLEIPVLHTKCF